MSLLTIGRDVVDNNLKSIRRVPFPDKFWRIPVPFNFPGKTIVLPMPNILVLSVYINRPEILRYFLDHGADVNFLHDATGWAPMHFAALVNDIAMMQMLVDHNADVNISGNSAETPICVAIATNKPAAVSFLIEHGASVEPVTKGDVTGPNPIQLAIESGSKDIIALLLHKGVSTVSVDFSRVQNGDELQQWLLSDQWKSDHYHPDVIADRAPTERVEDVLEFEYPKCENINPRNRYTDQRYVAEMKERNRCMRDESVSDTSSDESVSSDE